ncbi:MAG: PRC-barrel domain-containing protein [Arenimonas sp.]
MLRNLNDLQDYAIRATDGDIGYVKDFYIDDLAWVIRYFVVETGTWHSSRKVLISPFAFGNPNWQEKILPVAITREQVSNSPDIDTDKPVSRQHENDYLGFYEYPFYWSGPELWGTEALPNRMMPQFVSTPSIIEPQPDNAVVDAPITPHNNTVDTHLRSCHVVVGYHIHAMDGDIGHVQGMLVDDETWAVRYLVVNTSNWWGGHLVLIAPEWIEDISWFDGMVSLDVTRQQVKEAPPYDASFQLDRVHEVTIHEHYGSLGYWDKEQTTDTTRAEDLK